MEPQDFRVVVGGLVEVVIVVKIVVVVVAVPSDMEAVDLLVFFVVFAIVVDSMISPGARVTIGNDFDSKMVKYLMKYKIPNI